jgi:predicted nuclease of predicted toxin-antitoxin system
MRYHLDEHVGRAIAAGLRRRGIDVTTTPEVGLIAATDSRQLEFAKQAGRVIFTQDEDFLAIGRTVTHTGIVFSKQGRRSVGQIIEHLELIHFCLTPEDMANHIEFL